MSSALQGLPRGWDLACPEVWAGAESRGKPGLRVSLSVPSVAGSRVGKGEGRAGQGRDQWGSIKRPARGLWIEAELHVLKSRALLGLGQFMQGENLSSWAHGADAGPQKHFTPVASWGKT